MIIINSTLKMMLNVIYHRKTKNNIIAKAAEDNANNNNDVDKFDCLWLGIRWINADDGNVDDDEL